MVGQSVVGFHCYQWSCILRYRFSLFGKLSLVRHCVLQVSTVTSGTGFDCCQWSNTLRNIFPLLSVVQHFTLHIPAVISGLTLCVTYFDSYQWSSTVCYTFPVLSAVQHCVLQVFTVISGSALVLQVLIVISRPTLCVTYFHCYQWSNTVCYIFPLLSAVQHCDLHISTVISGLTLCLTHSHCYQRSNTVLQVSTVISGPTLCVTGFHCHQRSNTVWTSGGYSEVTPRKWLS